MAINIKNPEVEASIRKLAGKLGVDLTEAVGLAISHELERDVDRHGARIARMRAISSRIRELPILDARSNEEILDYHEAGLPA